MFCILVDDLIQQSFLSTCFEQGNGYQDEQNLFPVLKEFSLIKAN